MSNISSVGFKLCGFFCFVVMFFASCSKSTDPGPAKSSANAITAFNFDKLSPAVAGNIDEANGVISLTVPSSADITNIAPAITISAGKATVDPAAGVAVNFTNVVNYTVTAENGTKKIYKVTVTKDKSNANLITSFTFAGLNPVVAGVIDANTKIITATIPYNADIKKLLPTIVISDRATISPAGGSVQDFSKEVTYTVTAETGAAQIYKVNVKQAKAFEIQWQKAFGGTGSEGATSVQQTSDGGYIIAGTTSSSNGDAVGSHGKTDFMVVKINSVGTIEWKKVYGGSGNDNAYSIKQTTDGGYIVAGGTDSKDGDVPPVSTPIANGYGATWVFKINATGTIQWNKAYALNEQGSEARDVQLTSDGGYVLAINAYFLRAYGDGLVLKISDTGNIQWSTILGGGYHDNLSSIKQTADGGYIVGGATASTDGVFSANHNLGAATYDYYVAKLSATGVIEWQKLFGGKENDEVREVQQTTDGGFIVAGYSEAVDGDVIGHHGGAGGGDMWVLKLSNTGSIQWQKSLGGSGYDEAYSIQKTPDGGYVLAGWTKGNPDGDVTENHNPGTSDYWIVKLDAQGNIQLQRSFGGGSADQAFAIRNTADGGYIVAGQAFSNDGDVSGNHGEYDFWILKIK